MQKAFTFTALKCSIWKLKDLLGFLNSNQYKYMVYMAEKDNILLIVLRMIRNCCARVM